MDWFGLLVKEMKYNYFFSEKADGLKEGIYVTAGWLTGRKLGLELVGRRRDSFSLAVFWRV